MVKSKIMTRYPLLRDPWWGRIYFEEMFKNCCQIELNSNGTADLYDFNTGKYLMHFKNI